jgi:hypothetical protein
VTNIFMHGHTMVAHGHGVQHFGLPPRLSERHHHHHQPPRQGHGLDAHALLLWAMFVTSFLLLLAFPPLEVAALLQLSDRVFGSSFFLPTGLMEGGQHLDISGGGSPLLYQHLVLVPRSP